MNVIVLGDQSEAERIFGGVFDLLKCKTTFVDPLSESNPEKLLNEIQPDIVFLTLEWIPQWRIFAAASRRLEIPAVYVMDGVIEWSYIWNNQSYVFPEGTAFQPLLSSHLCVAGRHPARILSALGLADKIHIVGLARLDEIDRQRRLQADAKPRILICSAKTYAHNREHVIQVKRALMDLKSFFAQQNHINAIWRIDPKLADQIGVPVCDSASTIVEELRNVSAMISFTSTTLLEAMLLKVPTCQIEYRTVPLYVQTAWDIRSKEHIPSVVHELLYPSPEKLAYQDFCLEDELEIGNATTRLADVIKLAVNDSNTATSQQSAEYGKLDYLQVHSQLSCFSIGSKAMLQYELDACYKQIDLYNSRKKLFLDLMSCSVVKFINKYFNRLPGFKRFARIVKQMESSLS
jgi:hypothetical protein